MTSTRVHARAARSRHPAVLKPRKPPPGASWVTPPPLKDTQRGWHLATLVKMLQPIWQRLGPSPGSAPDSSLLLMHTLGGSR